MAKRTFTFLAGLLAVGLSASGVVAESRGLTVKLRASEAPGAAAAGEAELYGASHALVIGIDNYNAGWPRLSMAVNDAKLIAAELEKRGFDVTLETDLGTVALRRTLHEFFVVKGADPKARLFVWFAGHGYTEDGEGYLVPADAPRPETGTEFRLKALPMRDFGTFVRLARSKHALTVFDACFAGTVFDSQRSMPPPAVTRATTLPVRQFLTSGDAGQTVSDDGAFRELFIRALNGEERADANGDGYVTGTEIGLFLGDRMTNLTRARQTPRYGKLRDKDYDRGDFVFALPSAPAPVIVPQTVVDAAEVAFWQSIEDSTDPADFEDYLRRFPNGTFASLAGRKLARLRGEQQTAAITQPGFELVPMNTVMVTTTVSNVRAGPSKDARKLTTLVSRTRVDVTGKATSPHGEWYRIALPRGREGYIHGALLRKSDGAVATRPPPATRPPQPEVPPKVEPLPTYQSLPDATQLSRRAVDFARAGRVRAARRAAGKITDERLRIETLELVAATFADIGNIVAAQRSLQQALVGSPETYFLDSRAGAFAAIAFAYIRRGDAKSGRGFVQKIPRNHPVLRIKTTLEIAKRRARSGDIRGARQTARSAARAMMNPATPQLRRPRLMAEAAGALARYGDRKGALRIARQIEDQGYRALAFSDIAAAGGRTASRPIKRVRPLRPIRRRR
ncbi:MAG: caspase family protein [Alphaproteobacteria bacterium]|jgi:hypothetical protein|nr:caspase family protein [Alphaproteobacteria bacterium]